MKVDQRCIKSAILSLILICFFTPVLASEKLITLSTSRNYKLTNQEVFVKTKINKLEIGIGWKKTNPLVFSKKNKKLYVDFFETLISNWDGYLLDLKNSNKNTVRLGYLPTKRGELSVFFFRKLAHGKDFPDGFPRIRMVYCASESCIRGQVHFYTKQQILQIKDIIAAQL